MNSLVCQRRERLTWLDCKAYFLVHVRSLPLSTIPFVLVSSFPLVLTLTKYRTCLGYLSRKICRTIAFGLFFDSDCFFDYTRFCVTSSWCYTHDKSVPCLFSTCLDFFFGGCCEDIVRLSIQTRKNLSFTLVQQYILHWQTSQETSKVQQVKFRDCHWCISIHFPSDYFDAY